MKITHKHLNELYRAYAASTMEVDGQKVALIASEEKGYPCYMYSGHDFSRRQTVWENGGGCMSILPIPDKQNEFLAIVDFYLKETPSKAKLVWGKYVNQSWELKDVVALPYLHRFDIYAIDGKNYVVGFTIADAKDHKEDWTRPGSVYVGELPDHPDSGFEFKQISTGYFRNHGYTRHIENGKTVGYFTSDEGIFKLIPQADDDWKIEKVLDGMIGEVACLDINGDGEIELMTIEPFHGNAIKIYEKKNGAYEAVYTYPYEVDFAHTLVGDTLASVPCFVGGVRRVEAELFVVRYEDGKYVEQRIDIGAGPSNLCIMHLDDKDVIVSANHTRNESAVYFVE